MRLPRYTHCTEGGPQLKIGKLIASCRSPTAASDDDKNLRAEVELLRQAYYEVEL